jgi:hypothetical protein
MGMVCSVPVRKEKVTVIKIIESESAITNNFYYYDALVRSVHDGKKYTLRLDNNKLTHPAVGAEMSVWTDGEKYAYLPNAEIRRGRNGVYSPGDACKAFNMRLQVLLASGACSVLAALGISFMIMMTGSVDTNTAISASACFAMFIYFLGDMFMWFPVSPLGEFLKYMTDGT